MDYLKQKLIAAIIFVLAVVIAGVFYFSQQKRVVPVSAGSVAAAKSESIWEEEKPTETEPPSKAVEKNESEDEAEEEPLERNIKVYIVGAVVNPGVYEVKENSRIVDVLNLAGGETEQADLEKVNLALHVLDEQQIYIPKKGEVPPPTPSVPPTATPVKNSTEPKNTPEVKITPKPKDDGKVNINTATAEELKTLKGIGDVLADSIIKYREENDGFSSIDEIMQVNRIGQKTFEQIMDNIKVD